MSDALAKERPCYLCGVTPSLVGPCDVALCTSCLKKQNLTGGDR